MSRNTWSEAEKLSRIRLALSENVGPATFRTQIERFGTATAALDALPELSRRGGLSRPLHIYSHDAAKSDIDRTKQAGASFVTWDEPGYPPLLRQIDLPPPFLTIKGNAELAGRNTVAIVGARNASAVGRRFARTLASDLGAAGYVTVSGLARGIDTAAHEGALMSGTIAVLAGGIDIVYPPENEKLHQQIGETGLLISEMVPGTLPRGTHFPRRNRIISGISLGVVVVEAAMRSGSLITARLAGEQGRDVFAVPGSPLDPRAEGTNKLIREGAALITSASDVLQAYGTPTSRRLVIEMADLPQEEGRDAEASPSDHARIAALLSPSPVDIDVLIRESDTPPAIVMTVLLELELAGQVAWHPGQRVSLV